MENNKMKKIQEGEFYNFPITRLYIDDIKEIYSIFQTKTKKFEFVLGDYEIDDPSDIDKIPEKQLSKCSVQSYDPYVRINFRSFQIELYLSDIQNDTQIAIKELITRIIKKRKSKLNYLPGSHFTFTFCSSIIGGLLLGYLLKHYPDNIIYYSIFAIILFSSLIIYPSYTQVKHHTIIYNSNYIDRASFINKNRDRIILLIISLVLSYLLGKFG